jgi:hypothetical protein
MPIDPVQLISVGGAVLILVAFWANQAGSLSVDQTMYNLLNLVGAAVLAWVAMVNEQIGFVVLEGVWATISLVALIRGRGTAGVKGE